MNSYSVHDIADYLGVSIGHVYGLIRRGRDNDGIYGVKIGKSVRVPRRDFEDFLSRIGWDSSQELGV